MTKKIRQLVPDDLHGQRFDSVAAKLFPEYSRSRLQTWIKSANLTVNGEVKNQRYQVNVDDELILEAVDVVEVSAQPCVIDLDIIYEDDDILVINKPAGLVVHPGAGNATGTLMNGLLNYNDDLKNLPRAGIVHRLDKETSGLMVVAKTLVAHTSLIKQLQARTVSREYWALVMGVMTGGGTVEANIDRHPKHRVRMAVAEREGMGKEAITHYRVEQRFDAHTLVRCFLETGRTHQIRVHMAHIRYPLVGDSLYGGRNRVTANASAELLKALRGFPRQALHAKRLGLIHPVTHDTMEWECELPKDFQTLLQTVESNKILKD